jgi:4-hydroxy-tetrahydrodipicolinate synthase
MQLHGIIPPIVTPMKDDESLDLPRLRELIDYLLGHKVHGIFVLGTTGECYALDEAEKEAVMVTAVEQVAGRVPVLAGTGTETTRETIRLTRVAERVGINAVSIITPYYIQPTQAEITDHFRRIAEHTRLPVLLYSNPSTCGGLKINPETVARLAEVPNIVGIKDSGGDLQPLLEVLRLVPPTFAVFQGRDTLIAPALQYGAAGAVPGTCNLAPALCVALYRAAQAGDWPTAMAVQARLSPIRLGLALGTPPGAIKAGMPLLTMPQPVGPARAPLAPFTAAQQEQFRAVLRQAGL